MFAGLAVPAVAALREVPAAAEAAAEAAGARAGGTTG
jgi:hypothetical protein